VDIDEKKRSKLLDKLRKVGVVAGSKVLIDFLLNHARTFVFQTAMPPAICAASYAALEIIGESNEKRNRLFSNVK
jgi:8-amino-7-oxononanoate synthase